MGWEYINADRRLADSTRIMLRLYKPKAGKSAEEGYNSILGCASSGDRKVTQQPSSQATYDIEFQFPPKITTDSRKANWNQSDLPGGNEPVQVFVNSGPRELTMAWPYVVDSFGDSGWNIDKITKNIRTLRGYFALAQDRGIDADTLIVKFYAWCVGGTAPITALIRNVDVKYGETMVFPPKGTDRAFPLRTDITIDLRIWTKGMMTNKKPAPTSLTGLKDWEPPDWY